jgi:hypothetical protein
MNLTANITDKEMSVDSLPHTDLPYQMALLVADNLQAIRDFYKKPINIHVGYRNPEHNKAVGGVATSQHLYGEAADFHIDGISMEQIVNDIRNSKIKLPHKISQVILEESKARPGSWGWVHLGVFTTRWENQRKENGKSHAGNEFLKCIKNSYYAMTKDATEKVLV